MVGKEKRHGQEGAKGSRCSIQGQGSPGSLERRKDDGPTFRASMGFMPTKFASGARGFWKKFPMYFPIVAGNRTEKAKR